MKDDFGTNSEHRPRSPFFFETYRLRMLNRFTSLKMHPTVSGLPIFSNNQSLLLFEIRLLSHASGRICRSTFRQLTHDSPTLLNKVIYTGPITYEVRKYDIEGATSAYICSFAAMVAGIVNGNIFEAGLCFMATITCPMTFSFRQPKTGSQIHRPFS
jgi:hypothetical protein